MKHRKSRIASRIALTLYMASAAAASPPRITEADKSYTCENGQTVKLGLYEGTNEHPAEHLGKGLEIAAEMREMDEINVTVLGHSVPTGIFSDFDISKVRGDSINPAVNFNSGAVWGRLPKNGWYDRLKNGETLGDFPNDQLHVICFQFTWAPFNGPTDYQKNTGIRDKIQNYTKNADGENLYDMVQFCKMNYPNLKMILVQSDPWQNWHEPHHAYEEALIYRQLILDQINGEPELAFEGDNAKAAYIDHGGYGMWDPDHHPESYYRDCCHVTESGASAYQKSWLQSIMHVDAVRAWMAREPVGMQTRQRRRDAAPMIDVAVNGARIPTVTLTGPNLSDPAISLFSLDGAVSTPLEHVRGESGRITVRAAKSLANGIYMLRINDNGSSRSIPVLFQ